MVLVTLVDYRRLRDFAWLPYGCPVLLAARRSSPLGSEVRGTQAWFQIGAFQLQPAELAKVAVILAVAAALAVGGPAEGAPAGVRAALLACRSR